MAIGVTSIKSSAAWLYHESGVASLYGTGRDAWLVIIARACRMFAFGAVSLIMALFFAELKFTDFQIGLFMTLTLAGDVCLGLFITLIADGFGRRRILFAGGLLMALSGVVFYYFEKFWILLIAAVLGVVSATGGDFGPFRAIEESMLSHLTTPKTRADVLSWYVVCSSLGSAAGTEFAGRFIEGLKKWQGLDNVGAYHSTFWIYIMMGMANMLFAFSMSSKCEITKETPAPATESAQGLLEEDEDDEDGQAVHSSASKPLNQPTKSRFSHISSGTRSIMYKVWFLLGVDSIADGMVSQTFTNYYIAQKFQISKATLGDIISTSHILATIGAAFAGPLARHIGLVNTMVFTHLPSSTAVLFFPFPSGIVPTVILLFIRHGLNYMDQAPRAAFIAAVVKPDERTAVMGITSTIRTLASTIGPSFTGALAQSQNFWVAFVIGGILRITYDLGLWALCINMKLHTHEAIPQQPDPRRESVDEELAEMQPQGDSGVIRQHAS